MDIIKESNGIAVAQIGDFFYVVGIDHGREQVNSVLANDMPHGGGSWFAPITESGVQFVGHGAKKQTAMANFRRLTRARET